MCVLRYRVSSSWGWFACWLVACWKSQQHASVSKGRICSDNCTCCHTEIGVADLTFYLTQSQYTVTGPTSPSTDCITQAYGRVATGVPIFKSLVRGRNSSVGSAWARCPQRRGFDPPLGTFSVEGIFPLELTWVQTPFPPKLLRMRV